MRIVCVVPFKTSLPAVRSRIIPLLSKLNERGHEITLISPMVNHCPPGLKIKGMKLDEKNMLPTNTPVQSYFKMLFHVFGELKRDFDVVYVSTNSLTSGVYGSALFKIRGKPLVLDIDDYPFITHSSPEKTFLKRIVAKSLPRKAVKVIVASKGLLEYYREKEGLRNVIYIPNSADLSIFNPADYGKQVPSSEPTFVWSGILYFHAPWKFIVKAFKIMRNEARLLIVGNGPARRSLSKLLKSLKIKRKVEVTGWLPHTEVPGILASADIGLLPQYNDMYHKCKCPIKLFEYMAMKLPIVSTDVGEPAHMIRKTGCGVNTGVNYREFANAMDKIVENIEYWRERGELGRNYLERYQNWDLLSTKLEETLMDAISLTLTT